MTSFQYTIVLQRDGDNKREVVYILRVHIHERPCVVDLVAVDTLRMSQSGMFSDEILGLRLCVQMDVGANWKGRN